MINYETTINNRDNYKLDKNKKNILLIGMASSNNKQKIIINPINENNARALYGESDLYQAYVLAKNITRDTNIYTVNCPLYTDFIELIDTIVQYEFDFIVPTNIYIRDTFINPINRTEMYFAAYYLERLNLMNNNATIIMTDHSSDKYENMDAYLSDMNFIYNNFYEYNINILSKYGTSLVFVLNNFVSNKFSNVILAASLSVSDFDSYPENINIPTYFDIDYRDVTNKSFCFYKHYPVTNITSIEQLHNTAVKEDIYKEVLIDMLIKHVIKRLDLSEFNGVLFNPYVKVKVDTKITRTMQEMKGSVFSDYKVNNISFVKTGIGVGTMIIDLSITPYSLLKTINVILEV